MLEVTRKELHKYGALTPGVNKHIDEVMEAIPFTTVPYAMKAVIAVAQLTNFAAQFRRNLLLWDGDTEVPINAISFVITGSGGNKDSSVNKARKCFREGYSLLDKYRNAKATEEAIAKAQEAGEDCPEEWDIYKSYRKPIPPIDITPSSGPGLVRHVNDIGALGVTSSFIYSGEFSDELAQNPDMVENIKILSELYDLGQKNATYTKGVEARADAVNGQPVSALFVGSPGHILYDEATKKKFTIAFMSKLARRSWFCYTPDKLEEPTFNDADDPIEALSAYEEEVERKSRKAIKHYNSKIKELTAVQLSLVQNTISIDTEVVRLFKIYKRYNEDLANTINNQDSTYVLIRRHLQWKALKLAGAFALLDESESVKVEHYVDAIRFAELLDEDMERFERELNKATHERFSDYIRGMASADGAVTVSVHDIKKLGFLPSVTQAKLQELVTLCAGYDKEGLYLVVNENSAVSYEAVIKTDALGISFKRIDTAVLDAATSPEEVRTAKHVIASTTAKGFKVTSETTFAELKDLLAGSFAYSPFRFKDGIRGRDNIEGGTKWLVLDVDSSPLTAEETHLMLSDVNHHIALSSNKDDNYKYRVLIELAAEVTVSPVAWKHFYTAIAEDLAIEVDPLPQSQIFYSYAGRTVYSQLEATPLEVRDYVMTAIQKEVARKEALPITRVQAANLLNSKLTTFAYAYEAEDGEGSRSMIRAAYHAKRLGASSEYGLQLIRDIDEYWYESMPTSRLDTILEQVSRIFEN